MEIIKGDNKKYRNMIKIMIPKEIINTKVQVSENHNNKDIGMIKNLNMTEIIRKNQRIMIEKSIKDRKNMKITMIIMIIMNIMIIMITMSIMRENGKNQDSKKP